MPTSRLQDLQSLLDHSEAAILSKAAKGSPTDRAARIVFDRCRAHTGKAGSNSPHVLPVCDILSATLAAGSPKSVCSAFSNLAQKMHWYRRGSAHPNDARFWGGHANVVLVGQGGLEERDDVWIGATLMASNVTYVDHDHPPEEVYLALTPGEWWNAEMDWTAPGAGGLIYNPPGIRHAMRASASPFLALWFLPL